MEIYVLNRNLQRMGVVDTFTSLIWATRYSEIGDCELYVYATAELLELLQKNYYLVREDDEMICRIESIEIDTDVENGNYLIVKGYDCKKILNQRVIWGQMTGDGNAEDYIRDIVYKNLVNPDMSERAVENFLLGDKAGFTEVTTEQTSYKQVGEKVREFCKLYNWGYKVRINDGKFYFSLYKGTDRSDSVIFSADFENLISTKYSEDSSSLGNIALVAGEGEGASRSRIVSGYAENLDRYEVYVDARDISRTITWSDLTKMYPTSDKAGHGHIYTTPQQTFVYVVDRVDIQIVDNSQLTELQNDFPDGQVILKGGNEFYRAYNVIIADLTSDSPEESDGVTLRDVIYSVYLLNRGYDRLSEYGTVISFEGSVEPDVTFVYKQDYYLGDMVTVENEYGISKKARIVEVIETFDENGYSIEPKFEYIEVN